MMGLAASPSFYPISRQWKIEECTSEVADFLLVVVVNCEYPFIIQVWRIEQSNETALKPIVHYSCFHTMDRLTDLNPR